MTTMLLDVQTRSMQSMFQRLCSFTCLKHQISVKFKSQSTASVAPNHFLVAYTTKVTNIINYILYYTNLVGDMRLASSLMPLSDALHRIKPSWDRNQVSPGVTIVNKRMDIRESLHTESANYPTKTSHSNEMNAKNSSHLDKWWIP